MNKEARNRQIIALEGKKSYGLIAEELGVTRGIVAGVLFRNRYPREVRISSPNGRRNKIGHGFQTAGRYASETLQAAHSGGSRA